MMKVHFMETNDWGGLYVDGRLVHEGHSLDAETALRLLGIEFTSEWVDDLEASGNRCPKELEQQFSLPGFEKGPA